MKPQRIGITGGIASGKSTLGQWLSQFSYPVVDTDTLVHTLYARDPAIQAFVKDAFGPAYLHTDGSVNRKALGPVIFQRPELRKKLEAQVHPKIRAAQAQFFESALQRQALAFALVPLIYESGIEDHYDAIWVVYCKAEQQQERLIQTRAMSKESAQQRLAAQWPIEQKARQADVLLDNSKSKAWFHQQVRLLLASLSAETAL